MYKARRDCKQSKSNQFKLNALSYLIFTAFATESAICSATPSIANQLNPFIVFNVNPIYTPRLTVNGQGGSYGFGQFDYMYPLIGRDESLLMIDGRFGAATLNAVEGNLGLVYRQLVFNCNNILGAYAWVDRARTPEHKYFNQATFGGEFLGVTYDFRGNIYVPFGRTTQRLPSTFHGRVTGNTISVIQNNFNETALPGFDIEVGRAVPGIDNLRGFVDFFDFGVGNDKKVRGGRARLEYYVNYSFIATASYSYDTVRGGVGFIGFRASLGGVDQCAEGPMVRRMEDFVIRDIDIVTTIKKLPSNIYVNPQKYWFVNNAAAPGGNGTFEHPFNTEAEAEAAAGAGDAIYTFLGNNLYVLPNGGLNLKANQFFTGSGGNLIFRNVVIIPATSAPVLNGRINLANGTTISNLTISGSGRLETTGIFGNGVSNVTLSNLTIQDFTGTNANGTDNIGTPFDYTRTGGNGGVGGNITGITIIGSNNIIIENTTVKNIMGGDANGGKAIIYAPDNTTGTYRAFGGVGGTGGNATGIDLTGTKASLSHVTVSNVQGGSAKGGDGIVIGVGANSVNNWAYAGDGGTGGSATGINLGSSTGSGLNSVNVSGISGGSANGGDGLGLSGNSIAVYNYGRNGAGGIGGAAKGIDLISGNANLLNVAISSITGGSANAGSTSALGASTDRNIALSSFNAGTAGQATGLDLTNGTVLLSNVTVSNIAGGSANGGDATAIGAAVTNTGNASNGNNGGNAVGIIETGATVTNAGPVSVNNVTGGTANAGTGTTSSGTPGTPGTATNIQP